LAASHDDLGGLFPDLFQKRIRSLGQQPRDIARLRVAAARGQAAFDHIGQTLEHVGSGGRGAHR